jgi:hypothetical protein
MFIWLLIGSFIGLLIFLRICAILDEWETNRFYKQFEKDDPSTDPGSFVRLLKGHPRKEPPQSEN